MTQSVLKQRAKQSWVLIGNTVEKETISLKDTCHTSTQQTDGAEEPRLSVVHLQGKELVGKGKHQVGEWTEAGVVHLISI